ncbi:diaminopimelate decarboxylase [Candidatus Pacearchaeota archaeon]|nr:diaminopimelate decarboxylase [Candidatus Pacearchaeota archaeon]
MSNSPSKIEPLSRVFRDSFQVREIARRFGTPVYVYSEELLEEQADEALAFIEAPSFKVRYAMKANPNANILRLFQRKGIEIDASSGDEARRAIAAGIPPGNILLTSQIIPQEFIDLIRQGVNYNACSLHQLETFARFSNFIGTRDISVRINPGRGSGGTKRTNTGGPSSSFGIWHEDLVKVMDFIRRYSLNLRRVHTHIGSGSDPEVFKKTCRMSLDIVARFLYGGFPVTTLNLGGGYKVGRMSYQESVDMQEVGSFVKKQFEDFQRKIGLPLRLEIEPGTFLVANAGAIVSEIKDIKRTPRYTFLITDTGMNEVARPTLYAAQHPITVVTRRDKNPFKKTGEYVVSGRCCESGDILTPSKDSPEELQPRVLRQAEISDLVVIGGTGAYCSGMPIAGYNSYPAAPEVLLRKDGSMDLIRERGTLKQLTQNEVKVI